MATTPRYDKTHCVERLRAAGISRDDAHALRRIAMTLDRWHELECGDGNNHGSWAIERDDNGNGAPFLVHHHYLHGRGKDYITRTPMADREKGALKRLAAIMARYPDFRSYVQGDPRGASLYILRPDDCPAGTDVDSVYTRGIAVMK